MYVQGMETVALFLTATSKVHRLRTMSIREVRKACADIQLTESMEAHVNQETFLSNEGNKAQFITLLSHYLKSDAQTVHNSTGDTDTMIVACALQMAMEGMEVNVVADDTDVLILLMHHWAESNRRVFPV